MNTCQYCESNNIVNYNDIFTCKDCCCVCLIYTQVYNFNDSYFIHKKNYYKRITYLNEILNKINFVNNDTKINELLIFIRKNLNNNYINYHIVKNILKKK